MPNLELLSFAIADPFSGLTNLADLSCLLICDRTQTISTDSIGDIGTYNACRLGLPPVPEIKKKVRAQVQDSFTFPAEDHELIQKIIARCLQKGVSVNKSETLLAALEVFDGLSNEEILEDVLKLERIKTGRPRAGD